MVQITVKKSQAGNTYKSIRYNWMQEIVGTPNKTAAEYELLYNFTHRPTREDKLRARAAQAVG